MSIKISLPSFHKNFKAKRTQKNNCIVKLNKAFKLFWSNRRKRILPWMFIWNTLYNSVGNFFYRTPCKMASSRSADNRRNIHIAPCANWHVQWVPINIGILRRYLSNREFQKTWAIPIYLLHIHIYIYAPLYLNLTSVKGFNKIQEASHTSPSRLPILKFFDPINNASFL